MNDKLDAIQVIKDRLELPDIIHIELEVAFEVNLATFTTFESEDDLLEYLGKTTPTSMTVNMVE